MAKTIPSTFPQLDTTVDIRPGTDIITDPVDSVIEGCNFLYANHRQNIHHEDFEDNASGDGLHQGAGSPISTSESETERYCFFYVARAVMDNNDQVGMTTVALAETADGSVKVEFETLGGTVIDSITNTHTAGSETRVSGATSGGALDADTEYLARVYIDVGASGSLKLYQLRIEEEVISLGDMP